MGTPRGRGRELAVLDGLFGRARAGMGAALLLRGDPGVGKTALLEHAVACATEPSGMRVLRVAAAEAEATLPFAALHLLLRPALPGIGRLPDAQRRAIEAAFGPRTAGVPADRLLVGMATLSLLADLAADGPLLCVVDDAQWLDGPSADALAFAARRLGAEGVLLLAAARDTGAPSTLDGLDELRLTGLDEAESAALLDEHGGDLPRSARARILADADGNPLALRELPAALAAEPPGLLAPQTPLPLTDRLLRAFHDPVSRLPDGTRSLLLVAAADGTGDLGILLRATQALRDSTVAAGPGVDGPDAGGAGGPAASNPGVGGPGGDHAGSNGMRAGGVGSGGCWGGGFGGVEGFGVGELSRAQEAGVLRVGGGYVAFRHPLVRAAVYRGAGLAERHAVHRALAAVLTGPGDADRRAWHRAAAAVGPDEEIAAGLERGGVRARERGGYTAAAAVYERAARLSGDVGAAGRRLTLAAEAAGAAGLPEQARALAEEAAGCVTDPAVRVRAVRVRADAAAGRGDFRGAFALLMEGAEHGDAAMLADAAWAGALAGDRGLAAAAAARLDGLGAAGASRWLAALAAERPVPRLPPPPDLDGRAEPDARDLLAGVLTGQDAAVLGVAGALAAGHRDRGRIGALPAVRCLAAEAALNLGRPPDARVHAVAALELARECGQRRWAGHAAGVLAQLAAMEGDAARCRELAEAAMPFARDLAVVALGLLDLGRGAADGAEARLGAVAGARGAADLVEAAVRLGAPHRAAAAFGRIEEWAGHVRRAPFDALLARCRALLAPDDRAGGHFAEALGHHDRDARPFERARTELLYGEWLRRVRRRREARDRLRAAQETFERLGAAPWARRAAAELGATGVAARASAAPRRRGILARLTPQELRIVRLAGEGLTNRDIAARLFLSPRTVAYHLYKAYPKLDVSSRKELAALPLE
ncbi:LuxR family transcriptional regulator [Actinomadura algeriensis]|uniref:DNA-binding CsgD family transcriptional regulator n=1 Tax=Actinomadura algeriensis TaxID=1679523 RepID=A0ABR9JR81_9ACTN|nr:LuxR family transcriptional regulator [Actinomadura algeriensis]MBE1533075.1 DNA-binding CsgD family transcriptional regulator [Actinomadura algeriensis]